MKKKTPTIAILGGYGKLGGAVADMLLHETSAKIILCGRNPEKLNGVTDMLNSVYPGERVSRVFLDAKDRYGMQGVFRKAEVVIVCITGSEHTDAIARSCMEADADCIDLRYPRVVARDLAKLSPDFKASGRCFITQAGHLPGLASVLARYAGQKAKAYESITLATAISAPAVDSRGAAIEMVDIIRNFKGQLYTGGQWKKAGPLQGRKVSFGHGFGSRFCAPTHLEEMKEVPEQVVTRSVGVYLAGINGFVNAVVVPLIMGLKRVRSPGLTRALAGFLSWGVRRFSRPPYGAVFKMDAQKVSGNGHAEHLVVSLFHKNSYAFAGAAVAAGLLQYLDGIGAEPGLHFMGHEVEPERFLEDMERMGVVVKREELGREDSIHNTQCARLK